MNDTNHDILQSQIEYYNARAAEYDEWFDRVGRYDHGEELNAKWWREVEAVRSALHALPHAAHILEIAPGTGIWTQQLLQRGDHITAVDGSAEMIAINRAKVQSEQVTYIQADLFDWEPDKQYDMIFMGFWLSHVPSDRLHSFLQKIATALKPNGTVFMVDSQPDTYLTAKDHVIPDSGEILTRKLNDGQSFQIVKVFYTPEGLREAFGAVGIDANVQVTPEKTFIYAIGRRNA